MKRNVRIYVKDVYDNMVNAMNFTADTDYEAFSSDPQINYAVFRCLEIISCIQKPLPPAVEQDGSSRR